MNIAFGDAGQIKKAKEHLYKLLEYNKIHLMFDNDESLLAQNTEFESLLSKFIGLQ